ncbi:MAG: 16S rRNA processing protein RimM [Deltaproteobacteria bacterium]|nr:16S rRNA processing protein RimM [Deltaproteobacteria bacterium]
MAERWRVGRVVGARGLKGELKIQLLRPGSRALEGDRVHLATSSAEQTFALQRASFTGRDSAVISLDGVSDRDAAERWLGADLWVEPRFFPVGRGPSERLIGARVVEGASGRDLGAVSAIDSNGAQELLVLGAGKSERSIPLVDAFVERIDERPGERAVISVRLIPGLIEDEPDAH